MCVYIYRERERCIGVCILYHISISLYSILWSYRRDAQTRKHAQTQACEDAHRAISRWPGLTPGWPAWLAWPSSVHISP